MCLLVSISEISISIECRAVSERKAVTGRTSISGPAHRPWILRLDRFVWTARTTSRSSNCVPMTPFCLSVCPSVCLWISLLLCLKVFLCVCFNTRSQIYIPIENRRAYFLSVSGNHLGITTRFLLLSCSCKIVLNILPSWVSPYIDGIIGDHQCGFQCNRSTTDRIFCICQILEKEWEYNETVLQLFIDFRKAYHSVLREVLYSVLIEFGIPIKLVRLINMSLNETYSKVHIDTFFW
jgi:hypothetical protein